MSKKIKAHCFVSITGRTRVLLGLLLLFLLPSSTLANGPGEEVFGEILFGEEVRLLSGKGPFEVSGEPSSFAVAWVDEQNDENVLAVALFEGSGTPLVERLSTDLEGGEIS